MANDNLSDFLREHVIVIPVTMPAPKVRTRARCVECDRVFDADRHRRRRRMGQRPRLRSVTR